MSEELERYKKALEQLADYGHGCGCHPVCRCEEASNLIILRDEMRSIAHEALHPPPEVEEIPAVRVGVYSEDGSEFFCSIVDEPDARKSAEKTWPRCQLVPLTGTVKRPVKRPVVKSCPLILTAGGWTAGGLDALSFQGDKLPLTGTFTWRE